MRNKVKKLVNNGCSYAEAGRILNISRQRVHQLYKGYKSFSSNALSYGNIKFKVDICQRCRKRGVLIHHIDGDSSNNNSSNLMPLCHRCHVIIHAKTGKFELNFAY